MFYLSERFLIGTGAYLDFMHHVVNYDISGVFHVIYPLVYGLYFKQVRQPMVACLKTLAGMNKTNLVAPQEPMDVTSLITIS